MTKIIEVIISPSGETKIETKGFVGAECQGASRFLETALGRATSDHTTSEYHQQTSQHNTTPVTSPR